MRILRWTISAAWAITLTGALAYAAEPFPPKLDLAPGELQALAVEQLNRVAIGNPEVADVTVVSADELLVQAKTAGTTYLIVWDQRGRNTIEVNVAKRPPSEVTQQLGRILDQLHFVDTQVKQEGDKVYVVGQVPSKDDQDRVEQVLTMFPGVVNLTSVAPTPKAPDVVPAIIQLAVQVIEVNRTDLEKLGVKWSETLTATQPAETDRTLNELLFRWGTSLTRSSVSATLNALVTKNRARLLAEPKLVTASGKSAESFLGGEIPILTTSTTGLTTGAVSSTVEFKEVGVKLKMTPTASADNEKVTTVMEAEVSSIDTTNSINISGVTVPGFKTRRAQTEIATRSGETIVVAGLLQTEDSKAVSQVPALGSMPVLGRLFRSPEFQSRQTELVIAVTPQILADAATSEEKELALEQAMATAEVSAAVEDPKLRYALQVQDRIAKALRYPQRERELGLEGRVSLRIHIFADGTLGKVVVAQSSGIGALDAEALKAAETQAPYPPFPSQLGQQDVWLDIPVIFRP